METSVAQSPQILVDRPAPLETRERVPVEGSIREIAEGGRRLNRKGGDEIRGGPRSGPGGASSTRCRLAGGTGFRHLSQDPGEECRDSHTRLARGDRKNPACYDLPVVCGAVGGRLRGLW